MTNMAAARGSESIYHCGFDSISIHMVLITSQTALFLRLNYCQYVGTVNNPKEI